MTTTLAITHHLDNHLLYNILVTPWQHPDNHPQFSYAVTVVTPSNIVVYLRKLDELRGSSDKKSTFKICMDIAFPITLTEVFIMLTQPAFLASKGVSSCALFYPEMCVTRLKAQPIDAVTKIPKTKELAVL